MARIMIVEEEQNRILRTPEEGTAALIGGSAAMLEMRKKIDVISDSDAPVLIRGEAGAGKKTLARAIHDNSARRGQPIIEFNCAAFEPRQLEAELFGGNGRLEIPPKASLLLDGITRLSGALQERLMGLLDGGESDFGVRILATSSNNLESAVAAGEFRGDLLNRLSTLPMSAPPLRDHPQDILELCQHFLKQIACSETCPRRVLESNAMVLLQQYSWPGNVRELRNVLERASMVETNPNHIAASTIEPWLGARNGSAVAELAGKPLADIERQVILSTLQQFKGHRLKTAGALGIGVRTLGMKLKRWKETGDFAESGI